MDFLTPLSKVDENMRRSMKMDAIANEKFWFRKHVLPSRPHDDNGYDGDNTAVAVAVAGVVAVAAFVVIGIAVKSLPP